MDIQVTAHLSYAISDQCDLLVQVEAARDGGQIINCEKLDISPNFELHRIEGEDGIGRRFWLQAETEFECTYEASVSVYRSSANLNILKQTPFPSLPNDVVKYLMSSRFCHPEQFHDFNASTFGALAGGTLILAMCDWISTNLSYLAGASDAQTSAHDTFRSREGVCRDYAHVLIAMTRAAAIPARMVSAYSPDVSPQDFHAVVEVYLDGAWQLVDPTGMAEPENIVRIGVGRDAADVSFLTAYGLLELKRQSVEVSRLTRQ